MNLLEISLREAYFKACKRYSPEDERADELDRIYRSGSSLFDWSQ